MSDYVDGVQFYCDEDGWRVVLDGDMGSRDHRCDPADFERALQTWRDHMAEGGASRVVADNRNYLKAMARNNPELVEVYAIEEDFS